MTAKEDIMFVWENNKAIRWAQRQPVKLRGKQAWVALSLNQKNEFKSTCEKSSPLQRAWDAEGAE